MQSSFEPVIFRPDNIIKFREYCRISGIFYAVWAEKGGSKPVNPYGEPPFGTGFFEKMIYNTSYSVNIGEKS